MASTVTLREKPYVFVGGHFDGVVLDGCPNGAVFLDKPCLGDAFRLRVTDGEGGTFSAARVISTTEPVWSALQAAWRAAHRGDGDGVLAAFRSLV